VCKVGHPSAMEFQFSLLVDRYSDLNARSKGLGITQKCKRLNPKVRTILISTYNFWDEFYQKYMKEAVINSTIETCYDEQTISKSKR
jgi:hypothetical protein